MSKATSRPPERWQQVGVDTDALQDEYKTYAPKGEKCRRCHQPFGNLEVVQRVKPRGEVPSGRPYVHYGKCPKSEAKA
ncbi:hypothetical protein AB0L85_18090 [Streptomyces sp. NPDC052051]|uniref:hypothetical protein n=1 Tax=Streptomyces sp. NPDC052051 TaxID=3154649 RepID=UPI00342A0DE5